jgi:hypothetical protein
MPTSSWLSHPEGFTLCLSCVGTGRVTCRRYYRCPKHARDMGCGMAVYYLNRHGELVLSLFANEPRTRRRDRPRCGRRIVALTPRLAPGEVDLLLAQQAPIPGLILGAIPHCRSATWPAFARPCPAAWAVGTFHTQLLVKEPQGYFVFPSHHQSP